MSIEVRPRFEPPVPQLVFQSEGTALADQLRRILRFSTKRGLKPLLTDFIAGDDSADDSADEADDGESGGLSASSAAQWHAAEAGLEAVRALKQAIQSDPKSAQRWNKDDPDGLESLLSDLDELARCLELAATAGAKFRLEIG